MFFVNRHRNRFGNSYYGRHRGLFGGGLLSSLLLTLAPFLYRKYKARKNAGQLGLRESYPTQSEWSPTPV